MRAQERLQRGEMPSGELMEGAALIFGGALLMAPGFLSDGLGLLCLLPASRGLLTRGLSGNNVIARFFKGRFFKGRFSAQSQSRQTHSGNWQSTDHGTAQQEEPQRESGRANSGDKGGHQLEGDY